MHDLYLRQLIVAIIINIQFDIHLKLDLNVFLMVQQLLCHFFYFCICVAVHFFLSSFFTAISLEHIAQQTNQVTTLMLCTRGVMLTVIYFDVHWMTWPCERFHLKRRSDGQLMCAQHALKWTWLSIDVSKRMKVNLIYWTMGSAELLWRGNSPCSVASNVCFGHFFLQSMKSLCLFHFPFNDQNHFGKRRLSCYMGGDIQFGHVLFDCMRMPCIQLHLINLSMNSPTKTNQTEPSKWKQMQFDSM